MTEQLSFNRFIERAREIVDVEISERMGTDVRPETKIYRDTRLDSLDSFGLIEALEEEFDVQFPAFEPSAEEPTFQFLYEFVCDARGVTPDYEN